MGQENPQPEGFRMKDLFIDVKLEACVNGSTFDFLGRKLFSAEFIRKGIGFGITSIDIEINTSLQPIVTVVFKDLYGQTVFGTQDRGASEDGQSIDYSVIFNWPPPKFLFSFKGYLGKPTSWVLNLKRTTTSFNSSDGSYELTCEFVPNQWGFFADLPFLYLLAVKRLRKDKIGPGATESQQKGVTSVFDLIKIGNQVEIKTQDTTKEFDDLVKQLGSVKSNLARSLHVTNIVEWGGEIDGTASNQPTKDFVKMTMPVLEDLDPSVNSDSKIEIRIGDTNSLNILNTYLLLSVKFNGVDGFKGIDKTYKAFIDAFATPGSPAKLKIDEAKANALANISKNLEKVDDEIKRRVFSTSETKLEKITIGSIFSQLAKDAAFVMGSILDAGLDGYLGDPSRTAARDALSGKLIGESFPLIIVDGEEKPAISKNLSEANIDGNIGVDEFEMAFVERFIAAISEGIAKDLLSNNAQDGQDDSVLKQRVNNMEISSGNPYKAYYTDIATNILVRGGIVAFFTRSDDPNLPGDYDTTFGGDRDDVQSMEEIAERDMQNITDNMIKSLSDVDFMLLQRFCTFMSRYFTKDGEGIAKASGDPGINLGFSAGVITSVTDFLSGGLAILTGEEVDAVKPPDPLSWKVVMSNPNAFLNEGEAGVFTLNAENKLDLVNYVPESQIPESAGVQTLTFRTIWSELYIPSLLDDIDIINDALVFNQYEDEESKREDQIISALNDQTIASQNELEASVDGKKKNITFNTLSAEGIRNAQNPLSFVDFKTFTATRIVNNGIAYTYPFASELSNVWYMVFFRGEDNKRAQETNTAPTDGEFKSSDKDTSDPGFNEPLGYIPINAKYGEGDGTVETDSGKLMLRRIATLMKYRDDYPHSLVFDFDVCKNPGPGFYGVLKSTDSFGLPIPGSGGSNLLWDSSILDSVNDSGNSGNKPVDYTGNIGYTVCAHQGSDPDSGFVFGLFNPTRQGRNQRVFIRKAAEVLLAKINAIIDERNQIIGEVLGKAGENQDAIYKQMHTLFHQWQTLSYSDKISGGALCGNPDENKSGDGGDTGKVFNTAEALERRFGSNHVSLKFNETVTISKEEAAEGMNLNSEQFSDLFASGADRVELNLNDQSQSNNVPDGTFIYDYPMQRLTNPKEPINVRDAIINLEPLYKPNADTTILNIIQQVCSKNNFLFIPIPGNPNYLNVSDIYTPSRDPATIEVRNFFHVLFTPTPESRTKTRNHEGTPLALDNNQKTYNVNSFVIKYGHPDNQIVSNIQVGTDDNKVTAESIVNLQRLVDNENQNKKVTTDCSMLPVLAGRSYKATIDMIGNSQVYPMQFFFLENSPLFGGLYQIMNVKHSIDPNNMTTSLEGIRMRFSADGYGSVKPITLQTFRDLGSSEAPLALGEGFDEEQRALLKENATSVGAASLTAPASRQANTADYIGTSFVNGNSGGPVAQSVPLLPTNILNSFDTSLGVRDLWSGGKVIGSAQMYIFDGYPLIAKVVSGYKAMYDAAQSDGVNLHLTSGYRDPFKNIVSVSGKHISTAQYELRRQNAPSSKKNDDDFLRNAGSGKFSPETARPGFSNHGSGIAIDLSCGGDKFGNWNQTIYEWLMLNAYKYGFVRTTPSEEWHWEYLPGKAMFQYDPRNGPKWHGLVDKLKIPLNQPTTATTTSVT